MEKELVIINGFLGTNFTKMEDALLVIETLKTSNVLKYEQLQLLLLKEDEKDKKPTLPESVKVNQAKWSKSLKNSSFKKGFLTLTGIAKELEGLENFSQFNVSGTEVRVHDGNTIDTKVDSYLPICFIYDGKLVKCKIPVSKLASVEQEVLNGLPFQFSLCEFVETIIEGSEVAYIKYAFGPI